MIRRSITVTALGVVTGLAGSTGLCVSACSSAGPTGASPFVDGSTGGLGDGGAPATISGEGGTLKTFAYPGDPGPGAVYVTDLGRVERRHGVPLPARRRRVGLVHVHGGRLGALDRGVHRQHRQGRALVQPRQGAHAPERSRRPASRPPGRALRSRPAQGRDDPRPGGLARGGDAARRHHEPERQRRRQPSRDGRHHVRLRLQHRSGHVRRVQREPRLDRGRRLRADGRQGLLGALRRPGALEGRRSVQPVHVRRDPGGLRGRRGPRCKRATRTPRRTRTAGTTSGRWTG